MSPIFPYFIRALPARNKGKRPQKKGRAPEFWCLGLGPSAQNVPDCLIHILQIIENWTNLVATRITILVATENWTILVATRIVILVATENWTVLLRRDLLFSFCGDFLEN